MRILLSIVFVILTCALALPLIAAENPLVWDIISRDVEREGGQVVSVTFTVRVENPLLEEWHWKLLDDQPAEKPVVPGKLFEQINSLWHVYEIRKQSQPFEISVPVEYAGRSLTADQRKTLKALLRQEARQRRNDWLKSLIPKPDPRQRTRLNKAEVIALLGPIDP